MNKYFYYYLIPYPMKLKLNKDHHVKPKIIKIPVENVEENVWQIFLDRTQKHKP